jgi:hypothetical protein
MALDPNESGDGARFDSTADMRSKHGAEIGSENKLAPGYLYCPYCRTGQMQTSTNKSSMVLDSAVDTSCWMQRLDTPDDLGHLTPPPPADGRYTAPRPAPAPD